jgi:hypothetical protein
MTYDSSRIKERIEFEFRDPDDTIENAIAGRLD